MISERRSKAKTLPFSKVCPLKITGSNFSSCLLFTINFFFLTFVDHRLIVAVLVNVCPDGRKKITLYFHTLPSMKPLQNLFHFRSKISFAEKLIGFKSAGIKLFRCKRRDASAKANRSGKAPNIIIFLFYFACFEITNRPSFQKPTEHFRISSLYSYFKMRFVSRTNFLD